MRQQRHFYHYELEFDDTQITEPDQAFTPRQIVEQFARGELTAKTIDPSDAIDSSRYSDDQMMEVTEFEDEFEAAQYLMDTKLVNNDTKKDNKESDSSQSSDEGSSDQGD